MANYVANKIVCTEEILNNYFMDYYPFDKDTKLEKPYITFNKLYDVNDINEYHEKYGAYIYYGFIFSYKKMIMVYLKLNFLQNGTILYTQCKIN